MEHKTWEEVLPHVTFAYRTAVRKATGETPFQLVHGRKVATMLDAMLPHDDAQTVTKWAQVPQLARLWVQDQQQVDAGRYNFCPRDVCFQPGGRVWAYTPPRGLGEKLLQGYLGPHKALGHLGQLNYQVVPDRTRASLRRNPR